MFEIIGVRFDRQLIKRQVSRFIRQGNRYVIFQLIQCLERQTVHQIQIEIVEIMSGCLDGSPGFIRIVNAPQFMQPFLREPLDAD